MLVFAVVAQACCALPTAAQAAEPKADATVAVEKVPEAAARAKVTVGAGATTGRFIGLPYRAALLDGGVRLERGFLRWSSDGELELGQTEHGLSLYRAAITGGLENAGRFRIGAGARLSYTMVLRATREAPFASALFGDIGGFGIGAQGWIAVDVVRTDRFAVGLSLGGSADLYDGGTSLRLGALFAVSF